MRLIIDARKAFDSGIGTYIRSIVPRVLERLGGVTVEMLVPRGKAGQHDYVEPRGAKRIEVDARPLSLAEQWELRQHSDSDSVFWATSLAHPLFTRAPLVATVHDVAQLALTEGATFALPVRLASRIYFASIRRCSRAILVNSRFTRDELIRHVGIRADLPITVTPLGVEPEWFSARATARSRDARPYFVCVGGARPHKNLATLLRAFERVTDRLPHQLVVVGQQSGLRTLGDKLDTPPHRGVDRVRFAGFVPDAELRSLVAGADALVFPSLYEGFGLPALEAMAAGCPVIASGAGALPEVCGNAASYFEPRDVEALTRRLLEHAALTPDQRVMRVACGFAHARNCTWDHTAELTAAVLSETLAARRT